MNADVLADPRGGRSRTTRVRPAATCTTLPLCGARPDFSAATAIRTLAAPCGADSTILALPLAFPGLSATTPCSCTGPEPTANAPGAPAAPPGTSIAATTGTLAEISIAAGIPPSAGSATAAAEPPAS